MLEVRAGVFVGTLSPRVRDRLWVLVKARNPKGGSLLVARAQNEQGFVVETHGDTSRQVLDIEGLWLVHKPTHEPNRSAVVDAGSPTPPGRSSSKRGARSR
jgi:CRISPR-associated protein Cas2